MESKKLIFHTKFCVIILLLLCCRQGFSQSVTISGTVKDALTEEVLPFASVSFANTSIGTSTNDEGYFSVTNKKGIMAVKVSSMGYKEKVIALKSNNTSNLLVLLESTDIQLNDIVVYKGKERYSKKKNPAVELIKKVIEHKNDYTISSNDYYSNSEYERIIFSLNEYQSDKGMLKNLKFLENYADTSLIDGKSILPFSVRETISDIYYRKNPQKKQNVIKAYKIEGLDQGVDVEAFDGMIKDNFQDIKITDNTIYFVRQNFISPLSSTLSVDFYRWYIIDTVQIDQKKYVNLGFVPFNVKDVGFIGNIYVQPDYPYAVKKISFRVPSQINLVDVQGLLFEQEFEEQPSGVWLPLKFTTAINFSYLNLMKIYVEKEKVYSNFSFSTLSDSEFSNPAPTTYLADYRKQSEGYWDKQRATFVNRKDYKLRDMMKDLQANKTLNFIIGKALNTFITGYVPVNQDATINKLDIGTALTLFSHNQLEGGRFRLTASTTKNLHPHLFLYGYAAYGTKDEKMKYNGVLTWAFNDKKYHKDEFPKNNLSLSYKYDVNTIGQQFLREERDNILLSLRTSNADNMTYRRTFGIDYIHEYHNGFSFNLFGRLQNDAEAGNLDFYRLNESGIATDVNNINYNEFGVKLRYAHNEKFFQDRLIRKQLPSQGAKFTFTHTVGMKDIFGGQFNYQKSVLSIEKEFWITPFGRISTIVTGEKVWNAVPFPLLSMGYANNSLTVQYNTFIMLKPMEFMNDSQLTWDISYNLEGWLFNRIPLINKLKLREIVGFKGIWGSLSSKNNPNYHASLLQFPNNSQMMTNTPYMEYSIGVENILQFFRIDYVRRINYLNVPGIRKDGFVVSVKF